MQSLRTFVLLSVVSLTLLSGCLATIDLTSGSSLLDDADRDVARRIGHLTEESCVVTTQRGDTPVGTKVKLANKVAVRRLYASGPHWFKAEVSGQRAWDDIYWNRFSDELVCGPSEWAKKPESTTLVFKEVIGSQRR
ncbi:MAG: hypothetical protein K0M67_18775 [Thiobacillus sp.]|nr:hypothetical protein [Thiobacillus sp.]